MADRFAARPSGTPVLEIRGLNVFYGRSHALQGVDLTLRQGALSVVGRNGMGKTTLCNAIMGLVPARGSVKLSGEEILAHRESLRGVTVDAGLVQYIAAITRATRQTPDLQYGASIRGALAMAQGARALAALRGRAYVTPDDAKEVVGPALRHRVTLKPEAEIEGLTADDVLVRVLSSIAVPR